MRFNCGLSVIEKFELRLKHQREWHRHFTWWPTRIGQNDCRWLEWVERRLLYYDADWDIYEWDYRPSLWKHHTDI